jgi:hypothetical protein
VTDDSTEDGADGGSVLDPDDLELDDDRVRELDGNRYVVSTDDADADGPVDPGDDGAAAPVDPAGGAPDDTGSGAAARLAALDGAYAVEAVARTPGGDEGPSLRVAGDDVSVPFEALLRWYAHRVAPETPPEEAVAVLLANANLAVEADVDGGDSA